VIFMDFGTSRDRKSKDLVRERLTFSTFGVCEGNTWKIIDLGSVWEGMLSPNSAMLAPRGIQEEPETEKMATDIAAEWTWKRLLKYKRNNYDFYDFR